MRMRYTDPDHTRGVMTFDDGREALGPLPPEDGEMRAAFDTALAEGMAIEPYVAPAPPVPEIITDRQFFQGLAVWSMISEAEALAAVKAGILPSRLEAFVSALPEGEQFPARMILSGATSYYRSSPLTATFGVMAGMDATALDAFWRFCAGL